MLAFLRKHKDNMEQRMKYADQPEKFLDSEVDLDEHIKAMMQVGEGGLWSLGSILVLEGEGASMFIECYL